MLTCFSDCVIRYLCRGHNKMQSHFYGLCGLITIFGIHSTSAFSFFHDEPVQVLAPNEFSEKTNNSGPISVLPDQDEETEEMKSTSKDPLCVPVRPRELKFTEGKKRRKDVVLKAIRQILERNSKIKTKNKIKQDTMIHDVDFIAATDVVRIALLAKTRTQRGAKPEIATPIDKTHKSASELAQIKVKTRSKRYAKLGEINNGRDIVFEAVRQLIESEKTRRRFDMVNPPNSQYSKRQQLLWDRLRVKAAEELLLHPKPFPERATKRIYDTLKLDVELATPEPTMEPGLFNDFKRRIEQQYYLDEYDRWRGQDFISTLKPVVYE